MKLSFKTNSSMLKGDAEYDTATEQLFLTFKNDSRYRYDNVSKELYDAFKGSDSQGKAVKELLGGLPYHKVA